MGLPEHVPTFASYFPETALDEFDLAQRRDEQHALRVISEGIAVAFAPYGMSRELRILRCRPVYQRPTARVNRKVAPAPTDASAQILPP